jgi:hypothetical protein
MLNYKYNNWDSYATRCHKVCAEIGKIRRALKHYEKTADPKGWGNAARMLNKMKAELEEAKKELAWLRSHLS